ncbi:hypothetical protein F4824DRAFT_272351 [Ustulina deusta]|nr:hypothetical protein F4824DRAFT_272351 [Ustulina deusta]
MQIQQDQFPLLDPLARHEVDGSLDWHWAIVFKFVLGTKQDLVISQLHLDFFYTVRFALETYKPNNWHRERLIDYNNTCLPFSKGWYTTGVWQHKAQKWFWTLDFVRNPSIRRRIVQRYKNSHTRENHAGRGNKTVI